MKLYRTFALLLLASSSFVLAANESSVGLFERGEGFWTKPQDEKSTNFFTRLTDSQSQRENWYKISPYVAEFWCAVSNIGFIYVGIQHKSPELICAGLASIISHSIPKQWLLTVDKLGVALVASKIIREHNAIAHNPMIIAPLAAAGAINLADAYLARKKGFTVPHVIWHLSAAYSAHLFLKALQN